MGGIWGSNASLMRLLVVSAVGAWHRHGVVSQPTKICSACRISAALFCLSPTRTHTHIEKTHRDALAPHIHILLQIDDVSKLCRRNFWNWSQMKSWKDGKKNLPFSVNVFIATSYTQRAACRACCSWSIHLNSCVKVLLFGQFGGVALFVASLLFVLFVYWFQGGGGVSEGVWMQWAWGGGFGQWRLFGYKGGGPVLWVSFTWTGSKCDSCGRTNPPTLKTSVVIDQEILFTLNCDALKMIRHIKFTFFHKLLKSPCC